MLQVIVLFDGDCGICNESRQWVEARDRDGRLRFIPYQVADLAALSPGLTLERARRSAQVIFSDGRRVDGARAAFEVLRRLPGGWGVLGAIWGMPPLWWIAEPFYRLIAAHRARISGWLGLDYCLVDGVPQRVTPGKPSEPDKA